MKIFNPDGSLVIDAVVEDNSYRNRAIMGENSVSLRINLPEHVEFPIGAFCLFEGERYTLKRPQDIKMEHSRLFEYTLRMESPQEDAKIWKFRNPVDKRLRFPLTAKPHEHLQMFIDNMNEREEGWSVEYCIEGSEKLINYDHDFCWDALEKMAEEFGTEFSFNGKAVTLGKVERYKDDPLPLSYGKGHGFKSGVGRTNVGDTPPIETLFVQGGERNIDRSRYGNRTLLLPAGGALAFDGSKFEGEEGFSASSARNYVVLNDRMSVRRVGGDELYKSEDSIDLSEIYPKRVGTVSKSVCVDEDNNFYDFYDSSIPSSLDYEECLIEGETMSVIFQSGMLAGREFDVKYRHVTKDGKEERRFEIAPHEEDGITMPNELFKPVVGDEYAIFHCMLPDSYINAFSGNSPKKEGAEWDLLRDAVRYLYEHENPTFSFSGTLDGIWAKRDWENIGGKIVLGGHVLFSDDRFQREGVVIRIVGIKDYINEPHSPELELSNAPLSTSFYSSLKKLESQEVAIEEVEKKSISFTKRRFEDAKETMGMIADALGDRFTNSVSPISVQTMMALVGDESLQFRFIDANGAVVASPVSYDSETMVLSVTASTIEHMTLGISSISPNNADKSHLRWRAAKFVSGALSDAEKRFYLYAVCNKTDNEAVGSAIFELSEEVKPLDGGASYNLLVGILNSEHDGGGRSFVSVHGFTEILPGRITTDKVVSSDGNSFFDLSANAMQLGDSLSFNKNGDERLVLKGTFVQSPSGDTSVIPCFRGAYNDQFIYNYGDEVTYVVNSAVVTYRYKMDTPMSGIKPTHGGFWEVVAKGAKGANGTDGQKGDKGSDGSDGTPFAWNLIRSSYIVNFEGTTTKSGFATGSVITNVGNSNNTGFRFDSANCYKPNTTYTLAFSFKWVSGTLSNIHFHNGKKLVSKKFTMGGVAFSTPFSTISDLKGVFSVGKEVPCVITFTTPASILGDDGVQYTYLQPNKMLTTPLTFEVRNLRLYEGENDLPWSPNYYDLKGETGNTGATGATGQTGPKGERGDDGLTPNPNLLPQSAFLSNERMKMWMNGSDIVSSVSYGGGVSNFNYLYTFLSMADKSFYNIAEIDIRNLLRPSTWYTLSFFAKSQGPITMYPYATGADKIATTTIYFNESETAKVVVKGYCAQSVLNAGAFLRVNVRDSNSSFVAYADIKFASLTSATISVKVPTSGAYIFEGYISPSKSGSATIETIEVNRGGAIGVYVHDSAIDKSAGCYVDGTFSSSVRSDGYQKVPVSSEWVRRSLSFKTKAEIGSLANALWRVEDYSNNSAICMPKLEEGIVATPYIECARDLRHNVTEFRYAKNASSSTPPSLDRYTDYPSGWATYQPSLNKGEFLWQTIGVRDDYGFIVSPWTSPVRTSPVDGKDGVDGKSPAMVFRGVYDSKKTYYGNANRRDCVKSGDSFYIARIDAGTFSNVAPTSTSKWNAFGASFDSVATNTLLADEANIGNWYIEGGNIVSSLGNSSTKVSLDAKNGVISAKALNKKLDDGDSMASTNNVKSYVDIKASNAEIHCRSDDGSYVSVASSGIYASGAHRQFNKKFEKPNYGGVQNIWSSSAVVADANAHVNDLFLKEYFGNNGNYAQNSGRYRYVRNLAVGVLGRASNSGTAPCLGGEFFGLLAHGYFHDYMFLTDYKSTTGSVMSGSLIQVTKEQTLVYAINDYMMYAVLPNDNYDGMQILFMKRRSGELRVRSTNGAKINSNGDMVDYVSVNDKQLWMFLFIENAWFANRLT